MTEPADAPGYEIARQTPLVLLAELGVSRVPTGLAGRLAADFPNRRFIGILGSDAYDVAGVLSELGSALAEVIFTAASPTAIPGADLAMWVLNEGVIGQDFVFTVPELADAVRYGVDVLTEPDQRWEGTALLVLGSAAAIDEARRSLASS